MKLERTLIVLKPDALKRQLVGEILSRFEKAGIKIVASKMMWPDKDFYHKHYEGISKMISRRGQSAFDVTVNFMASGPVLAFVLEGVEVIEIVRKMVGPTEPKSAPVGTIRGDYAHVSYAYADAHGIGVENLIHASGNKEEAEQEIRLWFSESEIFEY